MQFKALSVVKPAGDLIRSKRKTIEVRQWAPSSLPIYDLLIIQNDIYLSSEGTSSDPHGTAIALVDLINTRPWTEDDMPASFSTCFETGWLAWELQNIRGVTYPHEVSAELRIYSVGIDEASLLIV